MTLIPIGTRIVVGPNLSPSLQAREGRLATVQAHMSPGPGPDTHYVVTDDGGDGTLTPAQCRQAPLRLAASYTLRMMSGEDWEEAGTDPNPVALWHNHGRPRENFELMGDDGTVLSYDAVLKLSYAHFDELRQLGEVVARIAKKKQDWLEMRAAVDTHLASGTEPRLLEGVEQSLERQRRILANLIELAQGSKATLEQLSGTFSDYVRNKLAEVDIPEHPAPFQDEAPGVTLGPR